MPHISQWSLSWQRMADPQLQISVMHLDSRHNARQRQAGERIDSTPLTWGARWACAGGFQPEASHLSQDIHCNTYACRGRSSSLPLRPSTSWTSPAPKAQLICSMSLSRQDWAAEHTLLLPSHSPLWESVSISTIRFGESLFVCWLASLPNIIPIQRSGYDFDGGNIVGLSLKMPFCAGINSPYQPCRIKQPLQLLHPSYQLAQIKKVSFENLSP